MRWIIGVAAVCLTVAGCAVTNDVPQPDVYPHLKSSSEIFYPGSDLNSHVITIPVLLYITPAGDVSKLEMPVSTGSNALDDTIRNSILHWRYYPAEVEGKAIGIWTSQKVTIEFQSLLSLYLSEIVVSRASLADSILQELRQGKEFGTLAKEHSVAESAKDGGYIGKVVVNDFPTDLWEAVARLAPGKWTNALAIDHQYAIYKREK